MEGAGSLLWMGYKGPVWSEAHAGGGEGREVINCRLGGSRSSFGSCSLNYLE